MRANPDRSAPISWWDRLALRMIGWEDCGGVPVSIVVSRAPMPAAREKLDAAIRLLRRTAPAHHDRLRRHLRGLILVRHDSADAAWIPALRSVLLDVGYLEAERASSASIAATLVHELTHARLDRLGVANTKEQRVRIEHICHRAERNFLLRLPESTERLAALEAIARRLSFDDSFWNDDMENATVEREPWYLRAFRFVVRS